ncbi:MAG: DNA polymerase III subunit alpha [Propionibacteriaceae bacterium]|nr:DNA polymerase III subunit alpha [Propionibacteriaceae bacterium]
MLDGAAKTGALIKEAERMGMPAIAMTDHGNMFGAYEFYTAAASSSVKPIIGIEAYVAPSTRQSREQEFWASGKREAQDVDLEGGKDVAGGGRYTHMTLLARNATGLHNLFRLSSLASFEGYYMKPRMDMDIITQYSEGLMGTTGCPSGAVQTRLRLGQYDEAREVAATYRDILGADNYFVELMDHGIEIESVVRSDLLKLAKDLNLRLVATNDSHYVTADQADAHDNLLCIGVGRNKSDEKRFRFSGSGYYLRSPMEMQELFYDVGEACSTTLDIAERVESYEEVFARVDRMPQFKVPEGETQVTWLRKKLEEGMNLRYGDDVPVSVRERVKAELAVIEPLGFSAYFLVVSDICRFARESGIRVGPGRGSATGSMVAYLTRITELDPIKHGLIFERFLNPDRVSPPDVDLDVDDRKRDRVLAYLSHTYGEEYTAQVNTFNAIKAKNAIKDSARILEKPFQLGEKIVKTMPHDPQGKLTLGDFFDTAHERYPEAQDFRALYESDGEVSEVVDTGRGIEGLIRGTGVHAAAVILSSEPLMDVIPLHMRDDGVRLTGFSYPQCEEMGLMKMDVLGLRNLGIIDHAIALIKENRGIDVEVLDLSLDDPKTYELLASGETLSVFQLDSGPMRALLKSMAPTHFEDIAAVLALYRPGPMAAKAHQKYADRKNGREACTPIHPELKDALEPILGVTYHLLVYQEQLMAITRELAGFTMSGADLLRQAMGKKKQEAIEAQLDPFIQGMAKNGFSAAAAKALWDVMAPFGGYAFNKSHTAGYGLVSYWTAYFKANYPAEYMAAVLESVRNDKDRSAIYLAESRRMGVTILPPDVNESQAMFTPVGESVRFGLTAVRNVGAGVVDAIIQARQEHGPAQDFYQFLDHVSATVCNKRVVESLILAGAFDSLGHTRRSLLEVYESAIDSVLEMKKNQSYGQDDLFGTVPEVGGALSFSEPIPELPDWDKSTKLAYEREMLGLYVSDHPLNGAESVIHSHRDMALAQVKEVTEPHKALKLAGMITSVVRKKTKKGEIYAQVTLEDLDTSIVVQLFSKAYREYGVQLIPDTVVQVDGSVRPRSDEGIDFIVRTIRPLDLQADTSSAITLCLSMNRVSRTVMDTLKKTLSTHPGTSSVWLKMISPDHTKTFRLSDTVATSMELISELKALLGASAVELGKS